jgi:hypothetical protein
MATAPRRRQDNQPALEIDRRGTPADPVEVLAAIAESCALRFSLGLSSWHDAIDSAWAISIKLGIETDTAQAVLAAAFAPTRSGDCSSAIPTDEANGRTAAADQYDDLPTFAASLQAADAKQKGIAEQQSLLDPIPIIAHAGVPSAAALQRHYETVLQRRPHVAISVLGAAEYLAAFGDPKRFEPFLRDHPEQSAAIVRHLRNRGRK